MQDHGDVRKWGESTGNIPPPLPLHTHTHKGTYMWGHRNDIDQIMNSHTMKYTSPLQRIM